MKKIKRKSVEMRRPDYKFCHYCDRKVKQEEIICPSCGRSLVRSLKGMGKAELYQLDIFDFISKCDVKKSFLI